MKILSISTDRAILEKNSGAQKKAIWLAEAFTHTHLVIFSTDRSLPEHIVLSSQLTVYPTRSRHKLFEWWDAKRIAAQLAKSDVSHVTSQDPFLTGAVGASVARAHALPFQVQIHTDISARHFQTFSFGNRVRMVLVRFVLRQATCFRAVGTRVAAYVRAKSFGQPVTVLPVWIDCERMLHAEARDLHREYNAERIFLTASRLEFEKNIDTIIKAFFEFYKTNPDSVLLVVGSGSLESLLKHLVDQHQAVFFETLRGENARSLQSSTSEHSQKIRPGAGAQNSVHFIPWTEDLPSYLKGADVYVSASAYEGFGLSLYEAQLAGCQLVTTDVGAVGYELPIGDSVHTFALNDVPDCVAAMAATQSGTTPKPTTTHCHARDEYLKQYRAAFCK